MKKVLVAVVALGLLSLLSGCMVEEGTGRDGTLPWSKPAQWENSQLGIPM